MTPLAELAAMDRTGLATLWSDLLGGDVPPKMSQQMQRRFLAFELQAKAEGGLSAALVARLTRIAQGEERNHAKCDRKGSSQECEYLFNHQIHPPPRGFLASAIMMA